MEFRKVRAYKEFGISFPEGSSKTKQSEMDACDINKIMSRYRDKGILPRMIKANPMYGDFTDVPSYEESLQRVIFAQEQFAALPSSLRDRFSNDPSQFSRFASDPRNASELIEMGLASKPSRPATLDDVNATLKAGFEGSGKASGPAERPAKGGTPKRGSSSDSDAD